MATLDELNVLLGADTSNLERGLAKGATSINGFAATATKAGASVQGMGLAAERAANGGLAAADKAAGRFLDSSGRMHEANGRFVKSATLAAEAAGNFGGSLGGASTKMGLFVSANAGLAASFQKADAARDTLDKGFGRLGESMKGAGEGLSKYVTLPIVAFGALAIQAGGDFESGMNRVEAATQAVGPELEALKDKAKAIAIDPTLKFSATDAAGALEALAKNGLTTAQILDGAADASVNLATATGGQLAGAADITTDVMNNFGKKGSELAGVVSEITGATIASKFGIEDYQGALAQAGAVAGQLGVDFTDFNTALSVTSSGFSSGSDAGTSFKTFLQRLVPQSNEAAEAMKKLGLNFFDAQGKMRPLREIAGELQEAFKGLNDQQRNELGTTIFGADSIRTALLLAKEGTEGFDKMAASIGKVNAAAQGKILSQGFNGALEGAKSAFEGFQLAVAESGILDFGTQLLQTAGQFLSGLAQLDPAILRTGTIIAALAAGTGPLVFGLGSIVAALPTLAAGFAVLTGPVGLAVAAIAGAAYLVIDNWDELVEYFTTGSGGKVFGDLADSVTRSIDAISSAFSALGGFDDTLGDLVSATGLVKAVFEDAAQGVTAFLDTISGAVNSVVKLFAGDFAGALDELGFAAEALTRPLRRLLGLTDEAVQPPKNAGYSDYFAKLTNDALNALQPVAEVTQGLQKLQDTAAAPGKGAVLTEEQIKALEKLRAALLGIDREVIAGINFDPIGDKISVLASNIPNLLAAGFSPNGKTVQAFVSQLNGLEAEYEKFKERIASRQAGDATIGAFRIEGPAAPGLVRTQDLPALNTNLFEESAARVEGTTLRLFNNLQKLDLPALPPLSAFGTDAFEKATGVIEDQTSKVVNAITGMSNMSVAALTTFNTKAEELFDGLPEALGGALSGIATEVATQFGNIITGASSFGSGLEAAFKGALGIVADFAGQFGQQMVALGAAKLLADKFAFTPGPQMIAAGLALIAVAGVTKALISKGPSMGTGGSTGGSASMPTAMRTQSVSPQKLNISVKFEPVTLRADGPSLRSVLNVDAYTVKRFG